MTLWTALSQCERDGRRDVEAFRRTPAVLVDSPLGAFNAVGGAMSRILRRALLAVRLPWQILAGVGTAVREPARRVRYEHFLAQYAYWRGVRTAVWNRRTWQQLTRTPIVLMYHAIGAAGERGSTYVVPRRWFRCQMAWLYWRGYSVIGLPDLARALAACRLAPPRAVVVTFDDGYADNYSEALPVLQRYGFQATFFLVTGSIGGRAAWTSDPPLADRPLLTSPQIAGMLAAGMGIGAHTISHASLTGVAPDRCQAEVEGSRTELERRFGRPVSTFAYPFGDCDAEAAEAVGRAGFEAACCSRSGRNDPGTPLFALRRNEVRGTDSFARFALMVWGGHAWRRARGRPSARPEAAHA